MKGLRKKFYCNGNADTLAKDKDFCASLQRVVMKKGTYPSIWKKS